MRKELIREVEMGPFKHTVDDGLDVRKAAFECMYTLLDSCLEGLDVLQFLDHVEEGLKDHYDIRVGRKTLKKPNHEGSQQSHEQPFQLAFIHTTASCSIHLKSVQMKFD